MLCSNCYREDYSRKNIMRPLDPILVTGKEDYTMEDLVQARLAICGGCSNNDNGLCWACGCSITSKVHSATSFCPLRLW